MKASCCLLFIVVSTLLVFEIHAERPAICREGSVHYCKDMQSAKVCGKLRFCQLVWNPPAGYKVTKNGNHWDVTNPNIGYLHVGKRRR